MRQFHSVHLRFLTACDVLGRISLNDRLNATASRMVSHPQEDCMHQF